MTYLVPSFGVGPSILALFHANTTRRHLACDFNWRMRTVHLYVLAQHLRILITSRASARAKLSLFAVPRNQLGRMDTRARSKRRLDQARDTEHSEPTSKRSKRTEKAPDSIPWEVFYMSVAALESKRSNCESLTDKVRRLLRCSCSRHAYAE